MEKIQIQERSIELKNGQNGTIAVLIYSGDIDPVEKLDQAVSDYVGNYQYNQFVSTDHKNQKVRVILSCVNEMVKEDFDSAKHKLKNQKLL